MFYADFGFYLTTMLFRKIALRAIGVTKETEALLTAPTLVVNAVDDMAIPFAHEQHTADSIPGTRLVSLPSGGHMLFGHVAAVRDEVTAFILGIRPG